MRFRGHTSRFIGVAVVLSSAALLAAGCGDDDSATDASDTTTTATQTETEADTMAEDTASETNEAVDAADIVDTAVEAGSFSTLVAAVQAAGLEETLRGEGPFTVFAPTDDAFAKLPKKTLDDLLKPENKQQLADILTYHAVAGSAVMSGDLEDGQEIETVNGETLTVSIDGSTVKIGDATVTMPDVSASNGVIHVIDTVLMPPS